jgi:hypothetical protein
MIKSELLQDDHWVVDALGAATRATAGPHTMSALWVMLTPELMV